MVRFRLVEATHMTLIEIIKIGIQLGLELKHSLLLIWMRLLISIDTH